MLGMLTFSGVAAENARVWVQFTPGQKAAVLGQVQAAGGTVHHEFDDLQAVAVTVPEPALRGLSQNPNVVLVEEDPIRVLFAETTPYGIPAVQAPDVWSATKGTGIKVGVIDSGVHTEHEDLDAGRINGYASGTGAWNHDGSGHGTHVVGTIMATMNNSGVVGVAPEASIYMVKVFGDSGTWAYSSSLVNAVQVARNNGAKIISMSLGGGRKSLTEESAFNSFYNNDKLLLIAAAGNDGTTTLSYPASYPTVISVAAVDQYKNVATFSQFNSEVDIAAPGVGVLSTVPYLDSATVTAGNHTVAGQHIENAARGTGSGLLVDGGLATTVNSAWAGKVVLVQRGSISFYDKVRNVQNSGGVAAVIYNNAPGGFSGTLGDGNSSTIPAISISLEEGNLLLPHVDSLATVSSSFSAPASGYAYYDGTSMATPHVSGVAALLWSAFPGKSNAEIRAALQNTAQDLGAAGRDSYYGYGLVQAKAAYDALSGSTGGGGTGDTTAPTISNLTDVKQQGKKYRITWTTNEPARSTVNVAGKTYTGTSFTTSHNFSVTGTPGANYTVTSTDAAGNAASATGSL